MRKLIRRLHEEDDGQVMILVAILMVGMVAVVGLVTDGGMVFTQRRDLQNVADAAAAAGASQIDEDAYRASAGASVVLDETAAYDAAARYLDNEGDLDYSVIVAPDRVDVSVSRQARTGFLRAIGINGVDIDASATAEPRHGIETAGP
ncbi:MAG: pilus assembly protein TadG-related protein [Dehalococcoidia bacterium]|nr:pilus assembly protein TadG-related protein [Dehalococcoidia bacterium]